MPSNEYMREYMAKRRLTRRTKLLKLSGGKCKTCPSVSNLEFDHREAFTKRFELSGCALDKAWSTILEEWGKCDLLCTDCHSRKTETHRDLGQVDHGGGKTGKRGCYCELCGPLKKSYMTTYMETHIRKRDR